MLILTRLEDGVHPSWVSVLLLQQDCYLILTLTDVKRQDVFGLTQESVAMKLKRKEKSLTTLLNSKLFAGKSVRALSKHQTTPKTYMGICTKRKKHSTLKRITTVDLLKEQRKNLPPKKLQKIPLCIKL